MVVFRQQGKNKNNILFTKYFLDFLKNFLYNKNMSDEI